MAERHLRVEVEGCRPEPVGAGSDLKRVVIISDVHANLPALRAVIADAGDVDAWWCLGDVVGYGPFPGECIDLVDGLDALTVLGNHDLGSVGDLDLGRFNSNARAASEWTRDVLSAGQIDLIRAFPETAVDSECDAFLVHGSPRDPVWEYVVSSEAALKNFMSFENGLCFNGHSHVPVVFEQREVTAAVDDRSGIEVIEPEDGDVFEVTEGCRYLVNAGSVGQPRDGDPRAVYILFEPPHRRFTYRRVEYDITITQRKMEEAGLPEYLARRLAIGR